MKPHPILSFSLAWMLSLGGLPAWAQPATGPGCGNAREPDAPPVRLEELGENWRYEKDADKLPVIRAFVNSQKKLVGYNNTAYPNAHYPICKPFLRDLRAGRNIEVIEPEFQALSENDPKIAPWMFCENWEKLWEGVVPRGGEVPFWRLSKNGLPPYLMYHIKLNSKGKKAVSLALYRQQGNAANHIYEIIDIDRCQVMRSIPVISSKDCSSTPNEQDALSMLIRYQGKLAILGYEPRANHKGVNVIFFEGGGCDWFDHEFDSPFFKKPQ